MKKQIGLFFLITIFLISCASKDAKDEAIIKRNEDKIKIGMIFDTFVVERWQKDRDKFVSAASEFGAEVDVQNANGDPLEQVKQMQYFIEEGVDVILIVPIESDVLMKPIQAAQAAGIKVISYDRLVHKGNTDLYISFDNEEIGHLMGETVGERISEGAKVLMVAGPVSDNNVACVNKGFIKQMEKHRIDVMDIFHTDGWKGEVAAAYIEQNLDLVEQADAIMCGNDTLAGQVIRVLVERRMADGVLVTGQDGDLEACQRIVEGTQLMTVYKPVEALAQGAALCAVNMIKGSLDETEDTMFDGEYEVPYIKLSPQPVTIQNIDPMMIESGFHLKEDVYMNRPDRMQQ